MIVKPPQKTLLKPIKDISLPTESEIYRTKVNNEEYKKLKKIIQQQAEMQEQVKLYNSMLSSYEGELSARPRYKHVEF